MGTTDTITKQYTSNNEVFADAFNYLIYQGMPIIKPEQLTELDTASLGLPHNKNGKISPVARIRDVFRSFSVKRDANAAYALLGIENQTDIHYAMPVRNMVYDALEYARQVSNAAKLHVKLKDCQKHASSEYLSGFYHDDKLIPVVTLVIYFSPEKWTAPLSIHEMLQPTDEQILSLTNDYKIHLLSPEHLTNTDLNKFQSSLRQVLGFIKYSTKEELLHKFISTNKSFEQIDYEAVSVINACTGYDFPLKTEKENINMCKAIDDMKKHSFEDGMNQGLETGRDLQLIEQIFKKLSKQKTVEIIADEVEKDLSYVQRICQIIKNNPNADVQDILQTLQKSY